jgi:amino acid adenylation domain-containing protein
VKILGHRIEPGEIEAAISSHPDVRAAAVTAPRGPDGEPRLVAYFVPRGPDAASALRPESLRAWLRERMPSYLVPAICVQLAAMPQTPNGKIDRKALPAPDAEAMPAGPYVAPRTPAEARVAAVWCELLQRPQVGVEENFFEVGGHSLLAMQLIARLRAELGADLSLRAIFEGPTIASIAARVAPTREAGGSAASLPAREPGPLPLSLGQRRLWFIEQLEPGRSTYHVPAAIRLRGACVPTALEQSFADLVRRHEALRTRFPVRDGEPFQDILPADDVRFVLQCDDLRSLPPTEREERARVVAGETAVAAFDLASGPVIRSRLIQLAEDDHLLVVVLHHIVSDGWTINLITRELTACYAARIAGAEPQLPPLTAHYADFAQWQRHQHSDAQRRASLDFWRSYLLGGVAAEIPADRPRPRALDGVGREYRCRWPRSLTAGLNHLAQREGATLFMALLAGYAAVLARHSRQDDLVLGTSVANRPRPEFEAMAGFFVNLLPVRVDLQGQPTFGDVMRRVKQSCLAGYAHQATPFESLIDAVAPVRDLSRTPIFQTLFVLLNTPPASARLAGLEITPVPLANRTAKFDVTLIAEEVEGELLWVAEYRTELYEEETLRRLLGHLRILLEAAVARPDVRLSDLPLLAGDELAAQSRWSRSEVAFPPGPWIHEQPRLVAPDLPALASSAGTLTYGEFNRRADALAARLQAHGVGPESRVAVCLERSPELVLALHAVLRAGGAYVPLDPDYPAERLAYMLADAAPVLVVTTEALAARLGVPPERTLRMESSLFAPASPALRVPSIAGLSAAYMIYTSGSTGRPKGAVNTHAAILNRLQWMQAALPLTTADRVLQKTPYSFDVSVWEFFWPLMTGATLVVADPGVHKDPAQLIELIVAESVTTLHFVPSMLRAFLETPGVERCTVVRQIVCSGEELPRDLVVMAHGKLPGAAVHNLYGPTEAAVDVSWHACRRGESGPVPIGGPIANVELHVLDAHLRPVPVGVPGEVYLGGVGLGRGYHGQPALTAERWVPDPAPRTPGARLYRTGDLGRWRPDGEIEYLGRLDFQVKLRGLRIELGEIDAALRDHADVADAVCALRQDAPAGARIVAYVVARGATPTAAVLRTWLGERLPDYMVPTAWVFLAALPLSPAGKVDRRALPAPQVDRVAERVAPRDGDEETVLAIWREVLGRDDLGMTDDFFEVGGHSLVATRVMTRLRERAGVTLPLRVLFQHPTAEALAAALRAERARGAAPIAAGALRRANRERRAVAISADGEIAVSARTNGERRG